MECGWWEHGSILGWGCAALDCGSLLCPLPTIQAINYSALCSYTAFFERLHEHPRHLKADTQSARWAENEFATLAVKDLRRVKRWQKMAADFHALPGASIPQASGSWAASKACYRLVESGAIRHHRQQGRHRAWDFRSWLTVLGRGQRECVRFVRRGINPHDART